MKIQTTSEIITIGDELLIGQVLDTNSQFIAQQLGEIGVRVGRRIAVGDSAAEITAAVGEALGRAQVVILTGGLGPTKDDITKKVLASYFGCGMVRDQATFERNRQRMTARGIEFNELNQSQADVPACCTVLPNMNGTAPGMWFVDAAAGEAVGGAQGGGSAAPRVVISLPGVPFEMERLMIDEVVPRLRETFALGEITHQTMVTFGIAESMLAKRIEAWENDLPAYLHLAYLPGPSGVRLRLSAYEDGHAVEIGQRFAELERELGASVVGYGSDATVQSAVASTLTVRGERLVTAESCTGGAVAALFTAMAGASDYFWGGAVSYDNDAKVRLLGVDASVIEREGAVSQAVAQQMALGALRVSGADWAIATTGIAGPTGGSVEKPVGTVWIAVAGRKIAAGRHPDHDSVHDGTSSDHDSVPNDYFVRSQKFVFGNLRRINISRAASTAVNLLREELSVRN